jgi:hypothetical protein
MFIAKHSGHKKKVRQTERYRRKERRKEASKVTNNFT